MSNTPKIRLSFLVLPIFCVSFPGTSPRADEVSVFLGAGPQPGSDQRNKINGIDYSFYTFERSARQHLQIGVSYSRWQTNLGSPRTLNAVSVYPQLTLYPSSTSRIVQRMPTQARPFFFARALGPTYISESSLGDRKQAGHFSFQAQLGAGISIETRNGHHTLVTFSWRHFSNANLDSPNDGMDVPFTIAAGVKY